MPSPIITGASLRSIQTSHRVLFRGAMERVEPIYLRYCQKVESQAALEKLYFGAGIPGLRDWAGKRSVRTLAQKAIEAEPRLRELTVGIPRIAIEDDQLGQFAGTIEMMGERTAEDPDDIFIERLNGAFSATLAYDGRPLCDNAHPRNSGGVQVNKLSGGSSALDADSFASAIKLLREVTDEFGKPLNLINGRTQLDLIVPPALEAVGKALLEADRLAGGATNVNYNRARLVVRADLTSDTAWFLVVSGRPLKPFIFLQRTKPELVMRNRPSDDNVFEDDEIQEGVRVRHNVVAGLWQLIVGSVGS